MLSSKSPQNSLKAPKKVKNYKTTNFQSQVGQCQLIAPPPRPPPPPIGMAKGIGL